jgi:hypothetical protein
VAPPTPANCSVGLLTQAALRAASEVMESLDAFTRESSAAGLAGQYT